MYKKPFHKSGVHQRVGIRKEGMERLLTLKEVCELMGSRDPKGRMVRNLRTEGKLEAAKFGRSLMFKESSVKKYIEEQFERQN